MSDKTKIVYCGPFDAVEIAATGDVAERDVPLSVDADLAASLLKQEDCWKKDPQPAPNRTPKGKDAPAKDGE